ncbi:SRPBCC family protein [Sinimarinibacterium sp. CAU 1509]|uniref:SRPBCC family protein n=1 Tax=Sinimarinibacterium sp. CAU 1509 TaxID=2562283 RepID=UPI0010AC8DA5|nr:SRPBCC family protein [Sinimarinibacterium sp. CAU 1509]TJY65152.1 SRPBCC family protein [Sinimarinibacterium sp. CAU 1509]
MPSQEVRLRKRVNAPIGSVFEFFADHERFATLFGARCRRIRVGDDDPNGLHSVRSMGPGPLAFEETIVEFEPMQRIAYQITRGSPLKNHIGIINFTDEGNSTLIDYVIRFDGKLPGVGPLIARILGMAWRHHAPKALAQIES